MSAGIPLLNGSNSGRESEDYPDRQADRYGSPSTPFQRLGRTSSPLHLIFICLGLVLVGSGLEAVRSSWASGPGWTPVRLDQSKLAVLLEKRNEPVMAPILIDFIAKVPPAWPFQVWTEDSTADYLRTVAQLKPHLDSGKLTLKLLPDPGQVYDGNSLSSFMAKPWWWEQLAPAEHIFFFQTDSIICGKSPYSLDDFLGLNETRTKGGYGLVGAVWPWFGYPAAPFGGNGGFSIRRRSVMLDITRTEERRDGWNEDEYFSHKIKESPKWGERMFADQHTAMRFSNEMLPDGAPKDQEWMYQSFGVHIGSGWMPCGLGKWDEIRKALDWCPEMAMVMPLHCLTGLYNHEHPPPPALD